MFALAMRPRRGGHAAHGLGADIADRAAGGCAPETIEAGASDQPVKIGPSDRPVEASRFAIGRRARKACLAELAEEVRRICRRGAVDLPPCASGLPELDQALGGGFARAAIHELLASCDGAAVRSIALLTAARAAGRHRSILLVDSAGDFYPPGAAQLGLPLDRLIIVRPIRRVDALWACEQGLRCTALAAVITTLARPLDTQTSRRLQLAAEAGRSIGLLIYPQNAPASQAGRNWSVQTRRESSAGQTFAATRLSLEALDADSRAGASRARSTALAGRYFALARPYSALTRFGLARRFQVRILKLRAGQPVEPFALEIPDPSSIPQGASENSGIRSEPEYREQWPPPLAV